MAPSLILAALQHRRLVQQLAFGEARGAERLDVGSPRRSCRAESGRQGCLPVAGRCITPCPLKPLAQKKPARSGTGPRMQWWSGDIS